MCAGNSLLEFSLRNMSGSVCINQRDLIVSRSNKISQTCFMASEFSEYYPVNFISIGVTFKLRLNAVASFGH
jgi:hypothetical protein